MEAGDGPRRDPDGRRHYTYAKVPIGFWLQDWSGWPGTRRPVEVHRGQLQEIRPTNEVILTAPGKVAAGRYYGVLILMGTTVVPQCNRNTVESRATTGK